MPEGEKIPRSEGALHHPFNDPEQYKKLHPHTTEAWIVYNRVSNLWRKNKGQVTPEDVINLFNDPKLKKQLWPDCTLYDVWLQATWRADNWSVGGPAAIHNESLAAYARWDQIAALIEEAMDLAGHRPPDAPKPEMPK